MDQSKMLMLLIVSLLLRYLQRSVPVSHPEHMVAVVVVVVVAAASVVAADTAAVAADTAAAG
jgi:hypothetical protein